MDQLHTLVWLAGHFALLSLFAVGGGVKILIPQIHHDFVVQTPWLTDRAFTELLAVAQAAPGPNFLLVPLIGYRIASWPGCAVAIISFLAIPTAIALAVGRLLHRHANAWVGRLRKAFKPITGGLWVASGLVVAATVDHAVIPVAITGVVAAASLAIDITPLWWCIAAGIVGYVLA